MGNYRLSEARSRRRTPGATTPAANPPPAGSPPGRAHRGPQAVLAPRRGRGVLRPARPEETRAASRGTQDDLLTKREVAQLLGYTRTSTIDAYFRDRPAYFPEPDEDIDSPMWLRGTRPRTWPASWA